MNKTTTFEQFLTSQSLQISIVEFSLNLLLAGFLSYLLGLVYIRFGDSISNRVLFAKNLILLTMTTMVVISIVKASLALSLGLVGALSIVRFRTAIKEPEELVYLFMAIMIGLGLGAGQTYTILVAVFVLILVIILRNYFKTRQDEGVNLFLTVNSNDVAKLSINKINEVVKNLCEAVDLKRYDQNADSLEVVYEVNIQKIEVLEFLTENLKNYNENMSITFIDQSGINL